MNAPAPSPRTRQVAERLKRYLGDPGDPVPANDPLAAQLHVGPETIRQAKQVLAEQGVITGGPRDYTVASPYTRLPTRPAATPYVRAIAAKIKNDLGDPGTPVPANKALAITYDTGHSTARAAKQLLAATGVITRKGTAFIAT